MYKREGRANSEARVMTIEKNVMPNAFTSVAVSYGRTKVFCTVSIEQGAPSFAEDSGMGWLKAEYSMLPGSTLFRKKRSIGKPDGRSVEIQRLIGRALRTALDLHKIQGFSLTVDCDVIQADGGTRTASITGGYLALEMAVERMLKEKMISESPLVSRIASLSAGKVDGQILLDLDYKEDSNAEVDFNIVMTEKGDFVEFQGTSEKGFMSKKDIDIIMDYCEIGIQKIFVQIEQQFPSE